MGSVAGCDGSEEFSASSVKKTPGGWGGYEEKEASNTSFKLQGKLSLVLQAEQLSNFSSVEALFKGKRISTCTDSKNENKRQTCSLELEAPNLQKKTARTQKKGR